MNEKDVPTRADIQAELQKVLLIGGHKAQDKRTRNNQRRDKVQQLLADRRVPPVERAKILDDLVSYPEVEDEE